MKERFRTIFYITLFAVIVTVVWLSGRLDIHPDEAYYFTWSCFLRSGYLDHPPAIAYLIKLSSLIFNGNFSIRGINILLSFLSLLFTGASIRYLWGNKDLVYYGLFFALISPLFIAGAVITTPDTPLIFFISAYIYFTLKSDDKDKYYINSILSGVFLGLAMLSKYTAFFVIISALLFYIRFRKDHTITIRMVIIPLLMAFPVYAPNLLYNIKNGFNSYLFQISHATSDPSFNPINTALPFILSQIFIFSPFLFVYFILGIKRLIKEQDAKKYFLFLIAIVPFTILFLLSIFKHVEANWAVFSFIPLLILTVSESAKTNTRIISATLYQIIVFVVIILHAGFSILPLSPEKDPMTQIKYWQKTYQMIRENIPENRTLVTFRYQISSILYYYSNKEITSLCLDRRFVSSQIGLRDAEEWIMIDFFPAKTAGDIAFNICPDRTIRIPLVISENMNIIRRIDIIYCGNSGSRQD